MDKKEKIIGIIGIILLFGLPILSIYLLLTKHFIVGFVSTLASIIIIIAGIKPALFNQAIFDFNMYIVNWRMKRMLKKMTKEFKK